MRTVAGFVKLKNRAAADNFFAEFDKGLNDVFQIHHHRAAVVNRQHIHTETGLQRREFVELVQDNISLEIAFDFDNHADTLAVGFIADFGNSLDFLFFNQFGNAGNQRRLVYLIGNFMNDNRFAVFI